MANETTLSQEELDSIFAPADPAKYDEWNNYQNALADAEANDPTIPSIPHDEVFRELEARRQGWRKRAQGERNAA